MAYHVFISHSVSPQELAAVYAVAEDAAKRGIIALLSLLLPLAASADRPPAWVEDEGRQNYPDALYLRGFGMATATGDATKDQTRANDAARAELAKAITVRAKEVAMRLTAIALAGWIALLSSIVPDVQAQPAPPSAQFVIARLKYAGGGDWYNGPTEVPNLLRFLREHTTIDAGGHEARVAIKDEELFAYPFVYMTGHGNVSFTDEEAARLRTYLEHGGFLFANDDYGMDKSFRREMKKVFPNNDLVEIPPSHGIFHIPFAFPDGLPKIHEHDGGPPHAYGIFQGGRLVVFYAFNTDIGDGWDDPDVHGDPPEKREAALRMGTNIVVWALTH